MANDLKALDGKWLAEEALNFISAKVKEFSPSAGRPPGLGVILVGGNPASKAYVANKEKAAHRIGFQTFNTSLSEDTTEAKVSEAIATFNENKKVDGILLQLPLPKQLGSNKLLTLILPEKDVDGLHPYNQGLLMRGEGTLRPCTPLGVMKLIDLAFYRGQTSAGEFYNKLPACDLSGQHAVVVGRSILVGKPVALMLLERNATVTSAHSKTSDLPAVCCTADILVAAVGMSGLIRGDWIKPGAVVIDVGINRLPSGKLGGDVNFDEAHTKAGRITPVPGGVGPMTVAMLMFNTLVSYLKRHNLRS